MASSPEKKPKTYEQPSKLVARPDYTLPIRNASNRPSNEPQKHQRITRETKDPAAHRPDILE